MPFGIIILIRVLFATCMVFILGYVFGNFSKNTALTTLTKVASILALVLFIGANIFFFRFAANQRNVAGQRQCGWYQQDSTNVR